jgi:sensor c-di-GMP phosphodiesterase-like protein
MLLLSVRSWIIHIIESVLKKAWIVLGMGYLNSNVISNKVLLFNRQYKYLGTRVYGAISKEIKLKTKMHPEKTHIQKVFSYTSLIV